MINGVHDIYYNVSNMEKAIEFYRDTLRMEVSFESENWTSMNCGGVMIGLHWTHGEKVPTIPRDAHGAHCGGTLTLNSDDVSADRKLLEKAGGKIIGEMKERWGHMLIFEDLDGNVLKLQNATY